MDKFNNRDKVYKNTLLMIIDMQEKYRVIVPKNVIENVQKLIYFFNSKNLPIAWTRYSRCLEQKYCNDTAEKTAISFVLDYYKTNTREKDSYKYGGKLWQLMPEIAPENISDNNRIFETNGLNVWNNIDFLSYAKEKKIKNVVIVGGWASYCIISTIQLALNFNIVPITASNAIFDKNDEQLKSSLLPIRRNSIYKSTEELINIEKKNNNKNNKLKSTKKIKYSKTIKTTKTNKNIKK